MELELFYQIFGIATVASPLLLLVVLGAPALVGRKLSETAIARCIYCSVVVGLDFGTCRAGSHVDQRRPARAH